MPTTTSLEQLVSYREAWRVMGWPVVLTNGVFDLMHSGHVRYLHRASLLGSILIVGINSDESTRAIKGPLRPLVPEQERAFMLASLRWVDYVTIFSQPTAETLVETLKPDIYVKGGDYARRQPGDEDGQNSSKLPAAPSQDIDMHRLPEARIVEAYGGEVRLLPYEEGLSTTGLIERIVETFGKSDSSFA